MQKIWNVLTWMLIIYSVADPCNVFRYPLLQTLSDINLFEFISPMGHLSGLVLVCDGKRFQSLFPSQQVSVWNLSQGACGGGGEGCLKTFHQDSSHETCAMRWDTNVWKWITCGTGKPLSYTGSRLRQNTVTTCSRYKPSFPNSWWSEAIVVAHFLTSCEPRDSLFLVHNSCNLTKSTDWSLFC